MSEKCVKCGADLVDDGMEYYIDDQERLCDECAGDEFGWGDDDYAEQPPTAVMTHEHKKAMKAWRGPRKTLEELRAERAERLNEIVKNTKYYGNFLEPLTLYFDLNNVRIHREHQTNNELIRLKYNKAEYFPL